MNNRTEPSSTVVQSEREQLAQQFAFERHGATKKNRKGTDLPYITHPEAVVALIRSAPHNDAMLCAGWLHDLVEDTDTTLLEIRTLFGDDVADLVSMLTDKSTPSDGNRKQRKEIDRNHSAQASPDGQTCKVADILHNIQNILETDPDFAKVYLPEKAQLLIVLPDAHPILWNQAYRILKPYMPQKPQITRVENRIK